jgi:hypothetical protein
MDYYVKYCEPGLNKIDKLHLGRCSNGNVFSVNGLNFNNNYSDLIDILSKPEIKIIDHYDREVSLEKLKQIMLDGKDGNRDKIGRYSPYKYSDPYYIVYADFC